MRELEDKLLDNNQELENSFSVNLDLLCIADLQGNFLKVNKEWEYVLGYSKKALEKRKFLEFVHPDDMACTLEAIAKLGAQEQVLNFTNRYRCKDGSYKYIEWRSQPHGELIYASARDISEKVNGHRVLEKMVDISEDFLQLYEKELDYQKIVDDFLDISGAKFAIFHLYEEDGRGYTTMAAAGNAKIIKKAMKILSLKIEGKRWEHDPIRSEKIKESTITRFASLKELTSDKIPRPIVDLLENTFYLGETLIIKILNNNIMLGDFTFIMPKDKSFNQEKMAEVYTRQLGLVIKQKRTSKKLERLQVVLSNEKKFLETTLRSVGDGVISTDSQGNIVFLNKVAESLTGWTQEEARGKTIEEVFHRIDVLTQEKSENRIKKLLEDGEILEGTHQAILISKEGTHKFIEDSIAPIIKENGKIIGVVLVFRDSSDQREKQKEILYLSYHDQLTGLYNRRFYEEELKRLDLKSNLPLTIVLGDVNGLKLVNDSFGHLLGDELLRKAAEAMTKGCRENDVIARIGGDEFVILLPQTDASEANQIIKGIKALAASEKLGAFEISISFGYEVKQKEEETIQETFKKAEDYMYRNKLYEGSSMRNKTIDLIVNTLYEKSNREMLHSKRVSEICEAIAVNMNFDQETVNKIRIAGLMHDIGKMGIDEKILNKPERLNNEEWKEIKKHPEIGYRILSSVNEFSEMAGYILQHHERWDGKGYPRGLKGEDIAMQARIITVADAYDAMVSVRAYRNPLIIEEAIAEIRRCSGNQFDPEITKVFIEKVLA